MSSTRLGAVAIALCMAGCGGATQPMQSAAPHIEADSGSAARAVAEPVVSREDPAEAEPPAEPAPEADAPPAPAGPQPSLAHWQPDAPIVLLPEVEANVRAIAARSDGRRGDVFAKIGDSATASRTFMRCFADDDELELAGRDELRPIIERFRARVAGRSSFSRESEAAVVGRSVHTLLRGNPSPVVRELRALSPRYALVMFGGNDVEIGRLDLFATSMLRLVDLLAERGVVPILSTTPPRLDDEESNRQVPRYDAVITAIARARRVPLIDLHHAMRQLPRYGLASDGVHPNSPVEDGRAHACRFDEESMQFGMNVRNLLNLRMLGHLDGVLAADGPAESSAPATASTIEGERFVAIGSTEGGATERARYAECSATDESGPERGYALHLDAAATVRAEVMYDDGVDVDVHLLRDGQCVARGDRILSAELEPGDYQIVVDTFESSRNAGEYVLLVER